MSANTVHNYLHTTVLPLSYDLRQDGTVYIIIIIITTIIIICSSSSSSSHSKARGQVLASSSKVRDSENRHGSTSQPRWRISFPQTHVSYRYIPKRKFPIPGRGLHCSITINTTGNAMQTSLSRGTGLHKRQAEADPEGMRGWRGMLPHQHLPEYQANLLFSACSLTSEIAGKTDRQVTQVYKSIQLSGRGLCFMNLH